jgi:NAD(P)-dependent dehydrogenase (short-subunit alcohol dehydrogenase family)
MTDDGRVALVTGANRGIGLEVTRQLAAKGYTVVLGSRDEAAGRAAAEGIDGRVLVHQLDVSDEASIDGAFDWVESELGRLDVLVNNAGIAPHDQGSGVDPNLDAVREGLETNTFGAWRAARRAIPLMRRNGYGRIVNVSSGAGQLSDMNGGMPAYRISKTALNAVTRVINDEVRDSGILVNSVCPGWVRTDMGGSSARLSVEEGADTPVWLATLPDDGPSGGFFRNREPIPW